MTKKDTTGIDRERMSAKDGILKAFAQTTKMEWFSPTSGWSRVEKKEIEDEKVEPRAKRVRKTRHYQYLHRSPYEQNLPALDAKLTFSQIWQHSIHSGRKQ